MYRERERFKSFSCRQQQASRALSSLKCQLSCWLFTMPWVASFGSTCHTYISACLPACLPACLLACLLASSPPRLLACSPARLLTCSPACLHSCWPPCLLLRECFSVCSLARLTRPWACPCRCYRWPRARLSVRMSTHRSLGLCPPPLAHMYMHTYIYTHTHTCARAHTRTYTYTYIYIYIYTYTTRQPAPPGSQAASRIPGRQAGRQPGTNAGIQPAKAPGAQLGGRTPRTSRLSPLQL